MNRPGTFSPSHPWGSLGLLLLLAAPATLAADDWPQFLGPTRDGRGAGAALATAWPKEGPARLWQRELGEGFSGPVVADGKLVIFHRQDGSERIECLDATNGRPCWSADTPTTYRDKFGFDEGPRATPAVAQGRIFTLGAEGLLSCHQLQGGKRLWQVNTRQRYGTREGFFGLAPSPLVENGLVIVNLGGAGAGIVAFAAADGREVWKATDDEASYASPIVAECGGQRLACVITREALVALHPADGRLFFRYPWRPAIHASVSAASPLAIGDLLFITASYDTGATLLRPRADKPEVLWTKADALSSHYPTPVHHEGFLYGFDGRQEQGCNLRCVELATGKVRWSQDRFGAGTIILARDHLLVLSERGELLLAPASPTAFKPLARAQVLGLEVRAHPALANGVLYARDKKRLVALDLRPASP